IQLNIPEENKQHDNYRLPTIIIAITQEPPPSQSPPLFTLILLLSINAKPLHETDYRNYNNDNNNNNNIDQRLNNNYFVGQ
ncbi:unnamed protein product, partial [Schistosoma margrebowiei]